MCAMQRERIDRRLVSEGLADSRAKAQALVAAGRVFADGMRVEKSGTMVSSSSSVTVRGDGDRWVSRGAHKLLKGLEVFGTSPEGRDCVDLGASTGGFTQVLLERGARRVWAVDVGYGQLAWMLRQDPRVTVMERVNARAVTPEDFGGAVGLVVADLSFISLKLVLPAIRSILAPEGESIVLVKPQFEIGKGRVGKGGVVRAKEDHRTVLREILAFCSAETGLKPVGLSFSPVTGPKGNIEFLLHLLPDGSGKERSVPDPEAVVDEAHDFFRKEG
ncbi:MAG TPA: TlyA family rRNA (cytidine-2'-O)-methyltransferase [Synergistaceae bacterium]|nr:TlyA family rRNA (cytidine-2'-O)-methyltransferase [Synergistaceae bacterium]